MVRLSEEDWAEIYYALDTKSSLLRQARFGTEMEPGQDARWIAHLKRIMRKIGPDGTIAAYDGASAAASRK